VTYSPPPGSSVTFDFGTFSYTPPPGSSVTFEFDVTANATIYPQGMFADGYGTPYVYLGQRWVEPDGIESGEAFGVGGVEYEKIRPTGIPSAEAFGAPEARLGQQWIYPPSIVVEMQAGHVVRRDDWYVAPDAGAVVLDFGAGAYTTPPGAFVSMEFEPSGTPTLFVPGIAQWAIGTAALRNLLQIVEPSGLGDGAYGSLTVELGTRYIELSGFDAAAVGNPSVINDAKVLSPNGLDQSEFGFAGEGEGFVDFARRELGVIEIAASGYGTNRVENVNRGIDLAGKAPLGTLIGTQFVSYKERFVSPPYIFANAIGIATIGFTRELQPTGFDASLFGVHHVHDNTQAVNPSGAAWGGSVSIPLVTRSPRVIFASGFDLNETAPSERWGRPDVVNLTQILPRVAIDPDTENGGVFGEPNNTLIENRNRTIVHYGHQDSRVSPLATLDNTGRALLAEGVEATAWGDALVAPAIRSYSIDGIPEEWFTPYHAVHNAAFQALPNGIAPGVVGTPAWANPPQAVTFVGHIDSQEHGTAFVDFAVRYIATPLGPEAVSGWHTVELATRYVAPGGLEATAWGATYVFEHFNIAAAHSILPPTMPLEHYVRNVTPQVYPYGYDMTEWGRPTVRWNPWPIAPEGFVAGEYGRLVIRDRRQTVAIPALGVGQLGQFAQVRNDSPDPPSQRTLALSGILATSYGSPSLRRNELYPSGLVATIFGEHEVRLVGAIVPGVVPPSDQLPAPRVVGPRVVSVAGLAPTEPPSVDLSPRTIWATFEVTAQAARNHPGGWTLVDDYLDTGDPRGMRPFFGRPAVTLENRRITVPPAVAAMSPVDVPEPSIESTIRTVYPVGSLQQRFGIASLPGPQILEMDGSGLFDEEVGDHAVENFDKDVRPAGLQAPAVTTQDIQLFNRELPAPSLGAGSPGTPRVHPPEPIVPGIGIQTKWGGPFVAYRIRTVYPVGVEAFAQGDEITHFADRMRVTKRYPIRPTAIAQGALGAPRVSDAVQRVQHVTLPPPGKPTAPSIRINNGIALGGLGEWFGGYGDAVITHGDNLEFVCGHAARAIPVVGLDYSGFGTASLQEVESLTRRVYPIAIGADEAGEPRIAVPLYVSGAYGAAFGDHNLVYRVYASGFDDEAIGSVSLQSVVAPAGIVSAESFGTQLITPCVSPSGWDSLDMSALYAGEDYFAESYAANDSGVWVRRG